jgi:hypothetical protein
VRYQLNVAQLQTQSTLSNRGTFDDASGRTFAAPTDAALKAAGKLLRADDTVGSWPVPYDTLRTDQAGAGAYPGVLLISADVPTSGLPAKDAGQYAQFLRFAAGAGQTPGLGNGQLPPGYLALSAANGLAALSKYTATAAAAVAAQRGVVPFVSGAPGPTSPNTGSGVDASSVEPAPTATAQPSATPAPSRSPSVSAAATPTPSAPSTVRAIAVGNTARLGSGPLGLALPILALAALIALAASALTIGFGRK